VRQPHNVAAVAARSGAQETALTQADVDAFLQHKKLATPNELTYISEHAKEFNLTTWQRNEIALQLTVS
jgi:hypothetical protein